MVSVISHTLLDCHIWALIVCNVDALADLSMCNKIINNYICTQVVSLLPFRLPNKPGIIPENQTNPVSHLFVTVIPSPNALSMCGISPERVVMSKSVTDFRHQVNKLHFCVYCGNGI